MEEPIKNQVKEENVLAKTFFWMFLGILGTAIVAWYTYSTGLAIKLVVNDIFEILLIVELAVVIIFSLLFRKLPPVVVGILYFIYAMLTGVTFSTIFYVFELNSIVLLFIASSLIFGVLALIGYKTKNDLTSWRPMLFGTLIIGLILSIINLFLRNSLFEIILDWAMLFAFFGITMYDMNKLKRLQEDETIDKSKLHIYGAMDLYLDFINIFIRILSIFGKRKS